MHIRNFLFLLILAIVISACSQSDMQGIDPNDYYAEHPVKNTVETRHALYTLKFDTVQDQVTQETAAEFKDMMSDISAYAVESVTVRLAPSQMENGTRRQHIASLLRAMEYPTKAIRFEASKETAARDAEMDVAYAVVVPPRCPDWRVSPVTSNSNTYRENFGCATTVNLGAQVADPRDLEKGSGKMTIDTPTSIQALKNYRSGESDDSAAGGDSTTSITPAGGSQ